MHANLRAMLMANQPFEYAHLIKFERPSRPDTNTGQVSTSAVRYTYITDASRDIGFDDGSKDLFGNLNGSQTYIANKVLKVSEVAEDVEAKASNFTLTIDGNGLGAELGSQLMTITSAGTNLWDLQILDTNVDPVYEGFREGDKIELYGARTGTFNIVGFRANNIIRIKKIDDPLTVGASLAMGIRLSSEEVKSILLDKNTASYSSFINREVFIYKVYQQDGVTIGAPLLLFKGIISNVSFDDSDQGIKVSWGLTSHWGDFAQVKGRISSDDFHRALDQNGNPQPQSALKPEYAYDKGFMHAETSINMLAKYIVKVEKQKIKAKNGFLGIGAKVKVKKYYVNEDRFTELDFQMQARSVPLHYGVRVTEGFPIFADTLKNDSATVYVAYMLGEGPVGGIYDIFIDGKSLICNDKSDFDARSAQTPDKTVDLICRGRADRGDVLGGQTSGGSTLIDYYATDVNSGTNVGGFGGLGGFLRGLIQRRRYRNYVAPTTAGTNNIGKGIIAGESISLTSPIDMTLDFFGGSESQEASPQLVTIAAANNFKIQNDYWTGTDTQEYWGPNHRLVDTAYIVAKYKISEGETSIPSLEFVLRGKVINCYNYDFSFSHYDKASSENANNFALGSTVDLYRSDTNTIINSGCQIVDKWQYVREDGVTETRFRFDQGPNLNYTEGVPAITKLYMKQGVNTWTMITFNFIEETGQVPAALTQTVTPTNVGGNLTFPVTGTTFPAGGNLGGSPTYSPLGGSRLVMGTISGGSLITNYSFGVNPLLVAD